MLKRQKLRLSILLLLQAGAGRTGEPTAAAVISPVKTLKNLVTPVDNLLFSPDGQVCLASRMTGPVLKAVGRHLAVLEKRGQ